MIILVLLISVSLTIALIFLGIFYWSVRSGQYDDPVTPSIRMLFEERADRKKKEKGGVRGEELKGLPPWPDTGRRCPESHLEQSTTQDLHHTGDRIKEDV